MSSSSSAALETAHWSARWEELTAAVPGFRVQHPYSIFHNSHDNAFGQWRKINNSWAALNDPSSSLQAVSA